MFIRLNTGCPRSPRTVGKKMQSVSKPCVQGEEYKDELDSAEAGVVSISEDSRYCNPLDKCPRYKSKYSRKGATI